MNIAWIHLAAKYSNILKGQGQISATEIDLLLFIYLFSEMWHTVKHTPCSLVGLDVLTFHQDDLATPG